MPPEPVAVGAILLAAGSSSRLGQPKQLLRWRGQTLLRNAAQTALVAGLSPIVVVLGSRPEEMASQLDGLPVEITVNARWEDGMGSSMQAGLRHLQGIAVRDAVLVLLCDQPLVTPEYLRTLVDRYHSEPRAAVASEYGEGVLGPPCLFARELFPKLEALSGAQGARMLLHKLPPEKRSVVPFPDGLADVDTWEDWERMRGAG